MIHGARVRQVRELLGETQTDFASKVGLAQSRLSQLENSISDVSDDLVSAVAEHGGFPVEFLQQPITTEVPEYQFRARMRFKAADRNRAVCAAEIVHEAYEAMRQEVSSVPLKLGSDIPLDPKRAAAFVRHLSDTHPLAPIPNLSRIVERLGVVILALPVDGQKHDAFCWWHNDQRRPYPVIATLRGAPADRLRWNVAHELGHVILHRNGGGRDAEVEADQFAAELLTPLAALAHEMPAVPKLTSLYAMKARWMVSVQSLIRRGRELGVIDEDRYGSLFRQLSARGERMAERATFDVERPRAFRKMAEVMFGDHPALGLAARAHWTDAFTSDVLAQYASRAEMASRSKTILSHASSNVIQLPRRQ